MQDAQDDRIKLCLNDVTKEPNVIANISRKFYCCVIYVRRKVRICTIPELSLRKVGILLCPPIPELYRTILELRKGYISCCHRILSLRKVGIELDKGGI